MLMRTIILSVIVLLSVNAQAPCIILETSPVPCQAPWPATNVDACPELATCGNVQQGQCQGAPASALCSASGNQWCCQAGSTIYFVDGQCQCSGSAPTPSPTPVPTPVPTPTPTTPVTSGLQTCWDGVSGGTITATKVSDVSVTNPVCTAYDFACTLGDPSCSDEEQTEGTVKRAHAIVDANNCALSLTNTAGYPRNVICCNKNLCNGPSSPANCNGQAPSPTQQYGQVQQPTQHVYGQVQQPAQQYGQVQQPTQHVYGQVQQPVQQYGQVQQPTQHVYGQVQQPAQQYGQVQQPVQQYGQVQQPTQQYVQQTQQYGQVQQQAQRKYY